MPNPQQILGLILKSVGEGYNKGYLPISEYNEEKAFRDKQYADILKEKAWEQDQAKRQMIGQGEMWKYEQVARETEGAKNRATELEIAHIPRSLESYAASLLPSPNKFNIRDFRPTAPVDAWDAALSALQNKGEYYGYKAQGGGEIPVSTLSTYTQRAQEERDTLLKPVIQRAYNLLSGANKAKKERLMSQGKIMEALMVEDDDKIKQLGPDQILANLRAVAGDQPVGALLMTPGNPALQQYTEAQGLAAEIEKLMGSDFVNKRGAELMKAGVEATGPNRKADWITKNAGVDSTASMNPLWFKPTTSAYGGSYGSGPVTPQSSPRDKAIASLLAQDTAGEWNTLSQQDKELLIQDEMKRLGGQ